MKYIKRIISFFLLTLPTLASAHVGGSAGEHGSYLEELSEWPPHMRQLHYYAEVSIGLLMIAFVIAGLIQRLRRSKKS
jgi:hypothetical protein